MLFVAIWFVLLLLSIAFAAIGLPIAFVLHHKKRNTGRREERVSP